MDASVAILTYLLPAADGGKGDVGLVRLRRLAYPWTVVVWIYQNPSFLDACWYFMLLLY
jgi:hypothetical protein